MPLASSSRSPSRKPGAGGTHAHVARHRLHDHRRDLVAVAPANSASDGRQVVERQAERQRGEAPRGRRGCPGSPSVARPEPAFDEQAVRVAVVAAVELHDRAPGP